MKQNVFVTASIPLSEVEELQKRGLIDRALYPNGYWLVSDEPFLEYWKLTSDVSAEWVRTYIIQDRHIFQAAINDYHLTSMQMIKNMAAQIIKEILEK